MSSFYICKYIKTNHHNAYNTSIKLGDTHSNFKIFGVVFILKKSSFYHYSTFFSVLEKEKHGHFDNIYAHI